MRVLHLLKTAVGATWALRQVRELVRLGTEIHVAVPDGPLVPGYRAAGCVVHLVEVGVVPKNPPETWRRLRALRALVDRVRPDLLHSHFVNTTLAMRIALHRAMEPRRIFQVPGPLHLESWLPRQADLRSATEADHWIGSCQWTCDRYLRSGVPPARVHRSFYGIDLEAFRPDRPAGRLREELGVGSTTTLVGMVAYMYAPKRLLGQRVGLKGHEDLIEALALLREQGEDVTGVFVGGAWDGAEWYARRVRDLARRRLGASAIFLGTRQDVPNLLQDLDLVVMPSHSENLGGSAESLLLECPTIASSVGGLPDLVRHGETGWLVPPHAPKALAAMISNVRSDDREARRRAARGRHLVVEQMDVRRTAGQVREIYRRVLGEHGPEGPVSS